jgi:hypothetical protein
MRKEYIRRKRANKPFTWYDLDAMNEKIHHDLDVVMSGVENVQENKQNIDMNKKLIRLTESDLHRIVKESVQKILKEEVDLGQIDAMRDRPRAIELPIEAKREIRRLRHLIDEYEREGKDTTELTNAIGRIKDKYYPQY